LTLLKNQPLINRDETPEQVLRRVVGILYTDNDIFKSLVVLLGIFKKLHSTGQIGWDEYRTKKMKPEALEMWGKIQSEMLRQGYLFSHVYDGQLYWKQITRHSGLAGLDPCTMCQRECKIRESVDSGEQRLEYLRTQKHNEPKKCWEGENENI
jgi:hypothetical protein